MEKREFNAEGQGWGRVKGEGGDEDLSTDGTDLHRLKLRREFNAEAQRRREKAEN